MEETKQTPKKTKNSSNSNPNSGSKLKKLSPPSLSLSQEKVSKMKQNLQGGYRIRHKYKSQTQALSSELSTINTRAQESAKSERQQLADYNRNLLKSDRQNMREPEAKTEKHYERITSEIEKERTTEERRNEREYERYSISGSLPTQFDDYFKRNSTISSDTFTTTASELSQTERAITIGHDFKQNTTPLVKSSSASTLGFKFTKATLRKKHHDRIERTFQTLNKLNPFIAKQVFQKKRSFEETPESKASLVIQKHYRGSLARKKYSELLYEKYFADEEKEREQTRKIVKVGLIQMNTQHLKQEIKDDEYLKKQHRLRKSYSIKFIQRQYRKYKKRVKENEREGNCTRESKRGGERQCRKRKELKEEKEEVLKNIAELQKELDDISSGLSDDQQYDHYVHKAAGINYPNIPIATQIQN